MSAMREHWLYQRNIWQGPIDPDDYVEPPPVAPDNSGGWTPYPGGRSADPDQGGSCQMPPKDDGGFTPAPGSGSPDPDQGGSCQPPPAGSSGSTPTSASQSGDLDQSIIME